MKAICLILIFVALGNAQLFLEDGKEYTYSTQVLISAGTMDYASYSSSFAVRMKTRIQVSGMTLNVKFENMEWSQYVGANDINANIFEETKWTDTNEPNPKPFAIKLDSNGLFKELVIDSETTLMSKNIMRGWASTLQINSAEIKKGNKGFKSNEELIHGNCDVTYTVTDNEVRKQVSIIDDCKKPVIRIRDDYRGHFCSAKQTVDYPASILSTTFFTEKKGDKYQINSMVSVGTYVAQFYEEEGSAQIVYSNSTSTLVTVKKSSGDISPAGETIQSISYEWYDEKYKWNEDRNLKDKEPFFSSGQYFTIDANEAKIKIINEIESQQELLEKIDTSKESINKGHKSGINYLLTYMYALDYDTLRSIFDQLHSDQSTTGTFNTNVYCQLIGNTGTTASAMLVRDLIMEGKLGSDRSSAKILTSVAYHIKRPNTQLVKEFEKLLSADLGRFTKMAAPLTIGHLIRMTCERARNEIEMKKCIEEFASGYVKKTYSEYQAATNMDEKLEKLSVISNIRYGGQSSILEPLIYGKTGDNEDHYQVIALQAVFWDVLLSGKGTSYFLPIFANDKLKHELRIVALEMLMSLNPSAADMSTIMTITYKEKDYEVVNYVYTLFERFATSIDPCTMKTSNLAKFYIKYMKQYNNYETDFGFGVSKTYSRQFYKKKYGYASTATFYVIGSHQSTTPLCLAFGYGKTIMNSYHNQGIFVYLRIEGLAKALVKKFKNVDPTTFKTEDLEKIIKSDMGIRERPDQPVNVNVMVTIKGAIILSRSYSESDIKKDGKIGSYLSGFNGFGDNYNMNYQRIIQLGSLTIEKPTSVGIPMAVLSFYTLFIHMDATVERKNHRGLLYRNIKYDMHGFIHANRMAVVPLMKATYGVVNDRIYSSHIPGSFAIGVNPIKKELKFSIKRPKYEKPMRFLRHSRTVVVVRGNNIDGKYEELQSHCSSCQNAVIVSKGPEFIKSRAFIDNENQKIGSYLYGEYFDCEMEISRGNVVKNLIAAFMPYNKNPKSLYNSIVMGFQQVRAFILHFPKNEQCGTHLRWSQSKTNPVHEIEIMIRGKVEQNGERLFFRGRKWFIKAIIKAIGKPDVRIYRLNLGYEFTPGYLENKLKVQLNRAPVPALGMEAFSACFALENKYPQFDKEFFSFDESKDLSVSGKAMVQYGAGNTCSETDGEIKVAFKHSTTSEARKELKNKWYYKQCMALKATKAWSGREGLPISEACYSTLWDATNARKYTWNIEFVKLTNQMKNIIEKAQAVVKAGLLPYWNIDPETMGVKNEIGPFMKLDATLKNDEKTADVMVETRHGEEKFEDVPLRLNWSKMLRNLKLTSTLKRLFTMKIINPCIVTSEYIRTNDNVTYSYNPSTCYTLNSASCGPQPIYAVFSKKVDGPLPMAMVAMIGGHKIEMIPSGKNIKVMVEDADVSIAEGENYVHKKNNMEIFKILRWGSTYNIYSFLKVWITYDGNFLETVPAPSTLGQHCGTCGNYNRNQYDEFTGKDMSILPTSEALVANYKWKC